MLYTILVPNGGSGFNVLGEEIAKWIKSLTHREGKPIGVFENPPEDSFVGAAMDLECRGWLTESQLLEALPENHKEAFKTAMAEKRARIEQGMKFAQGLAEV